MDKPGGQYLKWNKPDTKKKNTAWSYLYLKSNKVEFLEVESKMMITRGCGGSWGGIENGKLLIELYKVSV
jgi:hypothetical protein